jgi:hypothetical protein
MRSAGRPSRAWLIDALAGVTAVGVQVVFGAAVPGRRHPGVVHLQDKAGVDDRLVLLFDGVGERKHQVVVGGVVLVSQPDLNAGRGDDGQERLRRGIAFKRAAQVGDVALHRVGPVADRAGHHGLGDDGAPEVGVLHVAEETGVRVRPRVKAGELVPIATFQQRFSVGGPIASLDAVHPVADVPHPQGLAELAVVHDVDARRFLPGYHLGDRRAQVG